MIYMILWALWVSLDIVKWPTDCNLHWCSSAAARICRGQSLGFRPKLSRKRLRGKIRASKEYLKSCVLVLASPKVLNLHTWRLWCQNTRMVGWRDEDIRGCNPLAFAIHEPWWTLVICAGSRLQPIYKNIRPFCWIACGYPRWSELSHENRHL